MRRRRAFGQVAPARAVDSRPAPSGWRASAASAGSPPSSAPAGPRRRPAETVDTWVCASTTSIGASVPCVTCRSLLSTCARAWPSAFVQHVEIARGERQIPVRLLDERQLVHDDLAQLRVGQVDGAARQQDVPALSVDAAARAAAAAHRWRRQRRGKLGVEARELVAGIEPRRAEIHREPAAGPRRPADHAGAAVDLGPLQPAFGRAANRRRVRADVAAGSRSSERPADRTRPRPRARPARAIVDVEPGDRDVVVLLERHPDGVGEGKRQRRVGDADARCQRAARPASAAWSAPAAVRRRSRVRRAR